MSTLHSSSKNGYCPENGISVFSGCGTRSDLSCECDSTSGWSTEVQSHNATLWLIRVGDCGLYRVPMCNSWDRGLVSARVLSFLEAVACGWICAPDPYHVSVFCKITILFISIIECEFYVRSCEHALERSFLILAIASNMHQKLNHDFISQTNFSFWGISSPIPIPRFIL